jgi:transporter family-2 protein
MRIKTNEAVPRTVIAIQSYFHHSAQWCALVYAPKNQPKRQEWTQSLIKFPNSASKEQQMESILLIILIGLAGGVAVGLQGPLASMIGQRLGILESVFIVHIGGALIALLPLLLYSGGKLAQWKQLPWYTLVAGSFGLVVIAAVSLMIPRVGVAASIVTIVAGQLLVSAILDQYGLLGAMVRPLDLTRALGLAVVFVGVWLTVK